MAEVATVIIFIYLVFCGLIGNIVVLAETIGAAQKLRRDGFASFVPGSRARKAYLLEKERIRVHDYVQRMEKAASVRRGAAQEVSRMYAELARRKYENIKDEEEALRMEMEDRTARKELGIK